MDQQLQRFFTNESLLALFIFNNNDAFAFTCLPAG